MTWTQAPAWTGSVHIGCLSCSPVPDNVPLCRLDRLLDIGFGDVTVAKDGVCIYSALEETGDFDAECAAIAEELEDLSLSEQDYETRFAQRLEEEGIDEPETPTLASYEAIAASDPNHDWRVRFWGALHEEEYQRQGPEAWVLIWSGEGFA